MRIFCIKGALIERVGVKIKRVGFKPHCIQCPVWYDTLCTIISHTTPPLHLILVITNSLVEKNIP